MKLTVMVGLVVAAVHTCLEDSRPQLEPHGLRLMQPGDSAVAVGLCRDTMKVEAQSVQALGVGRYHITATYDEKDYSCFVYYGRLDNVRIKKSRRAH